MSEAMRIRDILDPRHIVLDLHGGSKREILTTTSAIDLFRSAAAADAGIVKPARSSSLLPELNRPVHDVKRMAIRNLHDWLRFCQQYSPKSMQSWFPSGDIFTASGVCPTVTVETTRIGFAVMSIAIRPFDAISTA